MHNAPLRDTLATSSALEKSHVIIVSCIISTEPRDDLITRSGNKRRILMSPFRPFCPGVNQKAQTQDLLIEKEAAGVICRQEERSDVRGPSCNHDVIFKIVLEVRDSQCESIFE